MKRLLLAVALLLWASGAAAQATCVPRDLIAAQLSAAYGERPVATGVALNGRGLMELWVSESGSWTLFLTLPSGLACTVASGEAWDPIPAIGRGA